MCHWHLDKSSADIGFFLEKGESRGVGVNEFLRGVEAGFIGTRRSLDARAESGGGGVRVKTPSHR